MAESKATPVRVYSMPGCGHCAQVKAFLKNRDIPFEEFDLATNVDGQHFMDERGYRVVPVTVVGDHELIGGDLDKLRAALAEDGLL